MWTRPYQFGHTFARSPRRRFPRRAAFAAAIGGEHAEADLRIIRADGEHRWVTIVASPVLDVDGVVVRVVETAEDITRRKTAEAALRESDKRFQQLAEL